MLKIRAMSKIYILIILISVGYKSIANENFLFDEIRSFAIENNLISADNKFDIELSGNAKYFTNMPIKNIEILDIKSKKIALVFHSHGQQNDKQVIASIIKMINVPVPKNDLERGHIITEMDLEWLDFPEKKLQKCWQSSSDIIGKEIVRNIRASKPISITSLDYPTIIKKKNYINVIYSKGTMTLKMSGIAMDSGRMNDTIRILNTKTGKIIYAKVTSSETAEIKI
jgi:flagella basal body P-ring formation protein FlgA